MLEITVSAEVVKKFKSILSEENNEDAVFRIRETKVGGGCKSHMELRVSIDEREDPDEEQEIKVDGLPFVVSNEVIDSYGEKFSVAADENGMPAVKTPGRMPDCTRPSCSLGSA